MKKFLAIIAGVALVTACSQEVIDEEAVEENVDSTANELLDELNAGFEEEATGNEEAEPTAADSMADAVMNDVIDEE